MIPNQQPSPLLSFIAKMTGILSVLLGASVLSGWIMDNEALKTLSISQAPMKPNAALAFILTGFSLYLTTTIRQNRSLLWPARIFSGSVLLFGLATLSEYIFGWDLGIDQAIFPMQANTAFSNSNPGRLTPQGGVCLVLLNAALLLLQQQRGRVMVQLMAGIAIPAQAISLIVHLFGIPEQIYKPIVLNTPHGALGILMLTAGVLALTITPETYQRIRLRLPILLFGIALLLLLISGTALRYSSEHLRLTYASVTQSVDILRQLESIMTEVEINSATNHSFLLTGQQEYLTLLARSRARLNESLKLLRQQSLRDAAQQTRLSSVQTQVNTLFQLADETNQLRLQAKLEEVAKTVTTQYDDPLIRQIRAQITEMEGIEETRLQERQNEALTSNSSATLATGLTGLTGFFFTIIAFLRLRQHLAEKTRAERYAAREHARLNTILRATSDGIHILDKEGRLVMANQAFLDLLGYDESVVGHMMVPDWDTDYDLITIQQTISALITSGTPVQFETTHKRSDGRLISVEVTACAFMSDETHFVCAASRDITLRKQNEKYISRLNILYTAMLRCNETIIHCEDEHALLDAICRITVEDGHMCMAWIGVADGNAQRIIPIAGCGDKVDGYLENIEISTADIPEGQGPTGTALRENRVVSGNHADDDPGMELWRSKCSVCGCLSSTAVPILRGGLSWGVLTVYSKELEAFDQQMTGLLQNMCNNISFALNEFDSKRARALVEEKLTLSDRVFNETHEGIIITDIHSRIVDVNPAFCAITGYTREEVLGQTPRVLHSNKQPPEFYAELWKTLGETGHWQGEIWNSKKNGELYAERLTVSALRDESGKVLNYVALFSDITQTKQQQQALELMAHYDALTQLPNRALFAERFSQAIIHSKRESALLAVCYLDLDGFKQVNDSLGHDAGDQLLIEVAKRIQANLRGEDTLSRLGGDEFALLLNDLESFEQCERVLTRMHDAIAQPYLIKEQSVSIAVSTGITLHPLDDGDPDTLLRHADQAMYLAKTSGRNRYRLFDSEQAQQLQRQNQQLVQIETAFGRHEFCLFYQPKVNMHTGEVVGLEALIRWNHPERGILPPGVFLSAVEGSPFELILGNWVIDTALGQMKAWTVAGLDINVSVNLAPRHLQDETFFSSLGVILACHPDIPPQRLQLEVVESSVLNDLTHVSGIIQSCRNQLGVGFALDDFGTGYSSLTYLRRLPVDTVKIDQSFVRDMIVDPEDNAIVNGVIALANAFNREVVAEGVETQEHGMELLRMGCYLAQGYGIARPMPADSVVSWVRAYRPDKQWQEIGRLD